ncbi:MAG: hypothetical protein QW044_01910 [Candidatus Anstonellales archaeon]
MKSKIRIDYGIDLIRFRNQSLEAQIQLSITNPQLFSLLLDTLPDRLDFIRVYHNIRNQLTKEHYRHLLATCREDIPKEIILDYRARDDLDNYDKIMIDLYISSLNNPYLRALVKRLGPDISMRYLQELLDIRFNLELLKENPNEFIDTVILLKRRITNSSLRHLILEYSRSITDITTTIRVLEIRKDIYSRGNYNKDIINKILLFPEQAEILINRNPKISKDLLHLALLMYELYGGDTDIKIDSIQDIFNHWSRIARKIIRPIRLAADAVIAVADQLNIDPNVIDSYANEYSGIEYKYKNRFLLDDKLVYNRLNNPNLWIEDKKYDIGYVNNIRLWIEEISDPERIVMLQYMLAAKITCLRLDGDPIRRLQLFGTAIDPNVKILALWSDRYSKPLSRIIFRIIEDYRNDITFLTNLNIYISNYDVNKIISQTDMIEIFDSYLHWRANDLGIVYRPELKYLPPSYYTDLSGSVIGNSYFE